MCISSRNFFFHWFYSIIEHLSLLLCLQIVFYHKLPWFITRLLPQILVDKCLLPLYEVSVVSDKADTICFEIWLKQNLEMKPKPWEKWQLIAVLLILHVTHTISDHEPSSTVLSLPHVALGFFLGQFLSFFSSLCLCFPPPANCSSFPQRDRVEISALLN